MTLMGFRALILIPFVLVFSCGPGLIFLRKLRWSPLEKIAGSIALSLTLLGGLTFAVYWTGLPSASYFAVTVIAGALTLAALPDWRRLLRSPRVRRTTASFGLLVVWILGAQSVIRHYSGADWCCDWVEHYQRTLFFLERWPKDSLFINRYLVTARPPFMNILCAYFLGNVGKEFAFYQIVFSLLNALVYFPCCLFARMFAPRGKRLPLLVAIFLAFNPTFVVNTTFTWTKALAAFFVILAVWLYLAGWRKHDVIRMSASFLCLATGFRPHNWVAVPIAFVFVAMIAIVFAAVGVSIGSAIKDMQGFQLMMSFLVMPIFFLSGALYPLKNLPAALEVVTHIDPLSYGVDGLRGVLTGAWQFSLPMDLAVLGALGALFLCVGAWLFSRIQL